MVALSVSLLGVLLAGACVPGASLAPAAARQVGSLPRAEGLVPILARELVVTSGLIELESGLRPRENPSLGDEFAIRSPMLRAWVGQRPRSSVEIEFVYLGPTDVDAPLGSGEHRRQIGVELRARDSCNVVYAMWRIEPRQELVVSLKSNPGQHQHSECADQGYVNLSPAQAQSLAPLRVGERHVLRATLSGQDLDVWVDGRRHWQGRLPPAAASLDGPVGLRSDNGQFDVRVRAGNPSR